MCIIMQEFGQVPAWWFTTGTGMKELEGAIKRIKERYELYGFEGPESASTDRCCHDRVF